MFSDCMHTLCLWLIINFFILWDDWQFPYLLNLIGYFPELTPPISPLALQFCAPQLVPALPYYLVENYVGGRCFIHHVIHQDAFFVKVNPVNLHYSIQIPLSIPRAFFQALLFNGILTFGRMIAITFFTAGDLCLPSLKRGVPLALSGLKGSHTRILVLCRLLFLNLPF